MTLVENLWTTVILNDLLTSFNAESGIYRGGHPTGQHTSWIPVHDGNIKKMKPLAMDMVSAIRTNTSSEHLQAFQILIRVLALTIVHRVLVRNSLRGGNVELRQLGGEAVLQPLYNLMQEEFFNYDIAPCEDTTIQVFKEDGRAP